jgi:hypothetical protein
MDTMPHMDDEVVRSQAGRRPGWEGRAGERRGERWLNGRNPLETGSPLADPVGNKPIPWDFARKAGLSHIPFSWLAQRPWRSRRQWRYGNQIALFRVRGSCSTRGSHGADSAVPGKFRACLNGHIL